MESLSHSRPPQNKPTKKPYKATTNASTYDDVFGGPTRFGAPASTLSPSMEDYAEIFGSFHTARASSIPVLDLPAVEESEVCFDLKSPRFDYTEVFGGVEEFGLSFDDFVFRSSGRGGYDGSDDDDDDAWTPADSDSLSGESDGFVQNQCSSNGDSNQSVNGFTEFSISNHRTSARNKGEIGNEETHVAQINKIPGFTCAVDETSRLSKLEAEALSFQLDDDGHLDNTSGEMISAKHTKNHVPHPANSCVGSETIPHDVTSHRVSSKSGFHPHEPFVTVSDVSLKTKPSDLPPPSTNSSVGCEKFPQDQMSHGVSSKSGIHPRKPFVTISEISLKTKPSDLPPPSRPPPGLDVKKGISKSTSNGAILSEGIRGMSSPPFFDVEVDSNSSAAASAAAMKEVMEKAQARLKSAKEQMERRKEGVQSRTKSVSVDAMKFKEGKIDKVPNRPCSSKGEMPPSSCDAENSGLKYSVREQGQISSDKTEAAKDLLPEGFYDSVHRSGEERLGKKSQSSRVSDDIEGADEWKEETQFFELVRTDKPRKAFEQTNSKPVAPNVDDCEFGQKKKDIVMKKDEQLEGTNIENLTVKDCLREKKEKKLKELKGTCEQLEENESMKPTIVKHKKEDIEKIDKMTSLTSEQEENKGKYRTALQDVRNEKKLDTKKKAKDAGAASEWTENKEKLKTAQQHIRSEIKQTGYEPSDDLVEIQLDEKANKVELKVEHRRKEKRLLDANKIMENEKQVESHKQDYNGWGQKKTLELEVKEKEVRKSPELVETDERQVDACRRKNSKSKISEVGSEKQEKESCSPENGVKRMNGALHPDENKKRHAEAFDMEEPEKELTGTHEREEKEKRRIRSSEKYNSRIMRMVEEKKPSEAYIELEMTSEKGVESTDLEKEFSAQRTVHAGVKDKISDQVDTDDLSAPEELNFLKDKQNNQANQSSNENGEFEEQLKETREASTHEVHRKETAVVEDEKVLEPVISIVTDDEPNMSSLAERRSQNGSQQRMNEATDLQTENEVINENEEKAGVSGAGSGETWVDKNKNVSEFESRSQNHGKKPENDGMERQEDNAPVQVEFCEVEKKNKSSSGQVFKGPFGNGKKIEVGPPASSLGGGNNQNASQQACSRPSHGRREKGLNEAVKSGDIESDKMRRERKLEEERLRKIEEEREREREREKDRMALDKETLEIREKASGERVAAEARQRVMTEARERLERACAEAREKTLTEKALDARLRAERAAVERATAEARARAAEKAMAERATLGTRDRMERSVSDKSFTHSRIGGMGQSCSNSDSQDHQFRSASFSNNTRYQHSPASCERSEGVAGESAQRCKARLERHRRTAERAAKALAEKNMRDCIVQREQAERSRLAETLDADVKRWSSGKQGNLRALLSTLQYILGPESGWQPIPLTEVITSAAVKKAYRKATLYVHPDKLQQRGASVQQKYICEKVFDLLKEAWTKFNSEER